MFLNSSWFQQKDVYRCASVKFRSTLKCDSVTRIVHEDNKHFAVEHNMLNHTCKTLDQKHQSKPVLSDKVIEEIKKLFTAKIRKPKKVLASLRSIKQATNLRLYHSEPTMNQIKYQLRKLKEEKYGKGEISLTELEDFLRFNSSMPEDENEAFVIGYRVKYAENDQESTFETTMNSENNQETENRSFWFLCSTIRLLNLASEVDLLCCDTTFKFLWAGYPAILIGTVDLQKQFHPIAFGFTSAENSKVFFEVFDVRLLQ